MPKFGKYKVYYYYSKTERKYYIGYTSMTLAERAGKDFQSYSGEFYSAIHRLGYEDFEFGILHFCETKDEALKLELQEIGAHNSVSPSGYNTKKESRSPMWDLQQEICLKYESGLSFRKIAREYNCGYDIVRDIVKASDTKIRTLSEARRINIGKKASRRRRDIDKYEAEICNKYLQGVGYVPLSREYGCAAGVIARILKENNIEIRDLKAACKYRRVDAWQKQSEICKRYLLGEFKDELGLQFGCSEATIKNILLDAGIKLRTQKQASQ